MDPSDKRRAVDLSDRRNTKLTKSTRQRLRNLPWLYIVSFLFLGLLIGGFIWHDLGVAYDSTLAFWNAVLSHSAKDRVGIISLWLSERRTDAEIVANDPHTACLLGAAGGTGSKAEAKKFMARKLQGIEPGRGYLSGFILDKACRIVAKGGPEEVPADDVQPACQSALKINQFAVIGSHFERGSVWIDLIMPVRVKNEGPGTHHPALSSVGQVILVFDPWKYMYSLIASESEPTRSLEALLIGSTPERVYVFSPHRVVSGEPALFQQQPNAPSFEALVARQNGVPFGEFVDYRGVKVFGTSLRIPIANDNLARKVDRDEALADYHRRAVLEMLAGTLAVLLFGVVMIAQHRHAALHELRARLQQQEALLDLQQQAAISEARYRDLFENANDSIVMLDLDGNVISLNKAAEKFSGYALEEAVKMNVLQILPPELQDTFPQNLKRLLAGETGPIGEVEFITKDGRRVPMEASAQLIYQKGVPAGMQIIARDVTERKRAEEALRHSERELREGQRLAQIGSWDWDVASDTISWSDELYRIARRDPRLAPPRFGEFPEIYSAESWQRLKPLVDSALQTGAPYKLEVERIHPDGTRKWFIARGEPVRDAAGRVVRLRGTVQDITDRKEAEVALQESEERFRRLSDAALEGLAFSDAGKVMLANSRLAEMLGCKMEELVESNVRDWVAPEYQEIVLEHIRASSEEPYEHALRRKDHSTFPVESRARYLPWKGKKVRVTAIRDITERKKAEQALRDSEERFRQMAENSPFAFILWDAENQKHIYVSPAYETIWGRNPETLCTGTSGWKEAVHLEDKPRMQRRVLPEFQSQPELEGIEDEFRILRPDGSVRWVRMHRFPVRNESGKVTRIGLVAQDITERKRAEQGLQASQEMFSKAFLASPEPICIVTLKGGRFLDTNQAFSNMVGYSREQVIGRTAREVGLTPLNGSTLEASDVLGSQGGIRDKELEFRARSGQIRTALVSLQAIEVGGERCVLVLGRDVTEHRRAEKALRESEQRYRDFISHSHEGVWRVELEQPIPVNLPVEPALGRLLHHSYIGECNDAMARIIGATSAEEVIGKHLDDLSIHKDEGRLAPYRAAASEGWKNRTIEVEAKDAAGATRYFLRTEVPIIENGMVMRIWGFTRDITDLKLAEAERSRLMAAIEQAAEGIVITDTTGTIDYVNPAFTAMTGYEHEEVIGENPRLLKSGEQDGTFYKAMWKVLLAGQVWHGELINRRKDGSLYPEEMTITPVRSERGEVTHFIAIKVDITGRRQLEEQLRQAQKMEAVGRLAGGVAHDFNNMLQIINGYSELLFDQLQPEDALRGHVQEIKNAVERAASLTRQLLAFSRQQVLAPQVLDLNVLMVNLNKMLRRLIGEDIDLVMIEGHGLGRVKADPGQIDQVILNLAVNARDAMPNGGRLTIETANVHLNEEFTRGHFPMTPGPYAMLAVTDTGCGMDANTQARLFEPFFTTKEKGKGTGLGLATVYGIIKQSGGFIWVQSEVGQGTTFRIYFPLVQDPTEVEREKAVATVPGGSETVLLAEDERDVRSLVKLGLEAKGYRVLEARNGEEALRVAAQHDGPIHMLITDLVMPEMGGRELVERLARLRKETKILFISAYVDDAIRHLQGPSLGATLLQKPFTADELASTVRRVLDGA